MGWIGEQIDSVKSIQFRQLVTQAISFGMIVASALIIWKALMCVTGSESPVVVVLSESMEPGFKRGDILFLHMSKDPIRAGEIVVFNVDGRDIPIVHRVIKVRREVLSLYKIFFHLVVLDYRNLVACIIFFWALVMKQRMCKWLSNFDKEKKNTSLCPRSTLAAASSHHGRAVGFLPYVGWVTIIMTEKPIIKYILIGALGLLVITSKD
ncbi:uncharacterized protein LOC132038044 [Lycium ferocissimum]|uniref:uncharacterized protein LOC132038044 n=1 Tax=Lycium ferocissimum TaxID=112874 RepID=UPI0028154536|nr:uncharacterized protein LOC132038044 [Lycium ferocissimum]